MGGEGDKRPPHFQKKLWKIYFTSIPSDWGVGTKNLDCILTKNRTIKAIPYKIKVHKISHPISFRIFSNRPSSEWRLPYLIFIFGSVLIFFFSHMILLSVKHWWPWRGAWFSWVQKARWLRAKAFFYYLSLSPKTWLNYSHQICALLSNEFY